MTVRGRLLATWAVIAVVLAVPALYAVARLEAVDAIAAELGGRHAAVRLGLGRLETELARLDRFQRSFVATPDPELRAEMRRAHDRAREQLDRISAAGYAAAARSTAARLDSLGRATARLEALVDAGLFQEATAYFQSVEPLYARIQHDLDGVAAAIDDHTAARLERARAITAAAGRVVPLALVVSLLLALAIALWSTGALTSPLERVRRAMARVAGGDPAPAPDLPYARGDEIGDLSRSFRSMAERLAELDRMRAEFISVATHELKTPVNVILGYAELLESGLFGPVEERQREALDHVQEQARLLARLVDQLLDISRIEAGRLPIEKGEVAVHELLAASRRAFDALARQKGIRFDVELDPSAPAAVTADPDRLRNEVLANLLSNAFKFTPAGGRIRLAARGAGRTLVLEVEDTGPGIPPDQLPRIFQKFYQVGREAGAGGAGLGLAIAREVVEAHHGAITAESEPGRGTVFRITIPA